MKQYQNSTPKILVIGDLMIDYYLWGESKRVSPEAPVPVVDIKKETKLLGGAGNVVNNLIALGAEVSVISVVGDDKIGEELRDMLKKIGVDSSGLLVEKGRRSTQKSRVIASNQHVIRFDSESREDISQLSEDRVIKHLKDLVENIDIILISDYAKGVLTNRVLQESIKIAKSKGL